MTHHLRNLVAVAIVTLSQVGCSTDDTVNLGETKGSALIDYAAEWKGHAEAYTFDYNAPTDVIHLKINADGTGTLRVGERAPYPPPTNWDVGYPEGINSPIPLVSGLVYPLLDVRVEDRRLRFRLEASGPYAEWCTHQTPIRDRMSPEFFRCIDGPVTGGPNGSLCDVGFPEFGPPTPVNCGRAFLCNASSLCHCTELGCSASHDPNFWWTVDSSLEENGSRLTGTLVGGERVTVKLERQ